MDHSEVSGLDGRLDRSTLQLAWSGGSHIGNVREINEDGFLTIDGMWVVADGMGGHEAGRVASEIVVQTCSDWANGDPIGLEDVPLMLEAANQSVRQRAITDGYGTIGSTVCGVALIDNGGRDDLLVFNVGDSRCYEMLDGGGVHQLTKDHSYVQELIDSGEITPREARSHPERNVVSRAMGIEDTVSADYRVLAKRSNSRLLICSDGVSGELGDEAISAVLASTNSPSAAVDALLHEVIAGPGRDNATAVVLDVSWTDAVHEASSDCDDGETTLQRADRGADPMEKQTSLIDEVPGRHSSLSAASGATDLIDKLPPDLIAATVDRQ